MRISDWSSDVCSSDLPAHAGTKNRCLTAWLRPNTSGRAGSKRRPYTQAAPAGKGFFVPFPQKTSVLSTVHQIAIIFLQLQGQGTDFEIPGASRLHRRDFRGASGQDRKSTRLNSSH